MAITHDPKLLAQALAQANTGVAGALTTIGPSQPWFQNDDPWLRWHAMPDEDRMRIMLAMRLNVRLGEILFPHFSCHKVGDRAFLLIVHNGKVVHFEEGYDLFPSDGLITQLRLLRG